jgi:hypothetical protein
MLFLFVVKQTLYIVLKGQELSCLSSKETKEPETTQSLFLLLVKER